MTAPHPACPTCGSSATLPHESEGRAGAGGTPLDVALGALFFFLSLLAVALFFLLGRASLPAALILLLALFLFWRQRREKSRVRDGPRLYVCLDCSHSFRA